MTSALVWLCVLQGFVCLVGIFKDKRQKNKQKYFILIYFKGIQVSRVTLKEAEKITLTLA